MKKILLSVLLILSLVTAVIPGFAEETWTSPEYTQYDAICDRLESFGVSDGTRHEISDIVSRAEFARHMVKLFRWDQVGHKDGYQFTDLLTDTKFLDEVLTMISLGYMQGYPDGTFRPTDGLLQEQAAKVMVEVLGYKLMAENMGGYPDGYVSEAFQLGIMDKIERTYSMTYGDFYNMLDACLEVDLMMETSDGHYEIAEDHSILSDYLKMNRKRGIVMADSFTAISGKIPPAGQICIDTAFYRYSEGVEEYLGMEVEFYTDQTDEEVLHITPTAKNEVLKIDAADILGYQNRQLEYEVNDKTRHATVESGAYVIYNNESLDQYQNSDFMPEFGSVRLLDNDGDGSYECAYITDITYVTAYMINQVEQKVYDYNDPAKMVDFASPVRVSIRNDAGKEIAFENIQQYHVLAVQKSKTGDTLRVEVASRRITGMVSEISNGDLRFVTVDGAEYRLINGLELPQMDIVYNFYLNEKGEIVQYTKSTSAKRIGYLLAGNTGKGLAKHITLKILSSNGTMVYPRLKDRVKIDGVYYDDKDARNVLQKGTGADYQQMIFYREDSAGVISEIDTPYNDLVDKTADYKAVTPDSAEGENSLRILYSSFRGSDTDKSLPLIEVGGRQLGSKIKANAETVTFIIPADVASATDEDYQVSSISKLWSDSNYMVEAYTDDEDYTFAKAVIVRESALSQPNTSGGLVMDIKRVIREDGDEAYKIKLWDCIAIGERELYTDSLSIPAKRDGISSHMPKRTLGVGDMIHYLFNDKNEFSSWALLYDADSGENLCETNPCSAKDGDAGDPGYTGDYRFFHVGVYDINGKNLVVTPVQNISADNAMIDPDNWELSTVRSSYCVLRCYVSRGKRMVEKTDESAMKDIKHSGADYSRLGIYTFMQARGVVVIYE